MAKEVDRGDIWLYRFGRPDKRRPVLVLSRLAALRNLRTAIVAPITSTIRGLPSEVSVGVDDGLKGPSVVNLDHLYTVPQDDLRAWLGRLDDRRMLEVCAAVEVALGCPAPLRW
jgi:mRNA interferase MazF